MNALKFLHSSKQLFFQNKFNISKVQTDINKILSGVKDGDTILMGGFGLGGIPQKLIEALKQKGTKNLTLVSNNCGIDSWGNGILLGNGQVRKMISSYVGENKQFENLFLNGDLEVELTPQGTLAEKCRAGGAGIPAFFTATGVDTWVEQGKMPIKYQKGSKGKVVEIESKPKERRTIKGRNYIMEESIFADVAFIKAWKADTLGNLVYRKSARNFNQDMATAAKLVIVEVEEIVEAGSIDPDQVHTSSVYVDIIYKPDPYEKKIEKLIFSDDGATDKDKSKKDFKLREKIVKRAVQFLKEGMYLNLGIGIPTLVPAYVPKGFNITLQSENGVLGVGDYPKKGQEDADLINAGKETITLNPGASIFSSASSFAMVRGGHLDLTILGAMQVSKDCDIANWIIPGKMVKGMGGAMDLVASGSKVMVVMEHTAKIKNKETGQESESLKILEQCNLPLTGKGIVDYLVTELAVFEKRDGQLVLTEIAKETTLEEVRSKTDKNFKIADDLKKF